MANKETRSTFSAKLLRPKKPGDGEDWAFVVLPREASAKLPRRGRTSTATGTRPRLRHTRAAARLHYDASLEQSLP